MKRLSLLNLFLFLSLVVIAHPSWALSEAEAQKLKTVFEDLLDQQARQIGDEGELVRDGEVLVEMSDSFYAVTLPHLTVKGADGSSTEIGIIAVNAVPGDEPDLWKMSVSLPTPITFYNPEGSTELVIHTGKQNAAGIWHEKLGNFVKLNAQYQDILATGVDDKLRIAIPEAQVIYGLNKNTDGLWSGPLAFSLKGFDMRTPDGNRIELGAGMSNIKLMDYDLNAAYQYRQQLDALRESYKSGEGSLSPGHMQAVYSLVADFIGSVWDGFTIENTVKDIKVTITSPESRKVSISEAGFDFGLYGFRENNVTMRLALDYSNLVATPPPAGFNETTPHTMTVDIAIEKLPFDSLKEVGLTALTAGSEVPQMAQMAALQALMSLPEILTKAGTSLKVTMLSAQNEQYQMEGTAALTTDNSAAKGAVGKGQVKVAGIENLMSAIQQKLQDPSLDPEEKTRLQQFKIQLTVLQMVGQQSTNEEGKQVRLYDFELTKDGQMLLNGSDLGSLIGGQGNKQPEAAPAP